MTESEGNIYSAESYELLINKKAQECYELLNSTVSNLEDPYCPGLFDGWACWPDTPAGEAATQPCPEFIVGFDPNRTAHRICEESGDWFFHEQFNKTWSNYTTCVNEEDLWFRQMILTISTVGYSISLVALIISLGVLTYFRSLRCSRITIHMNLFASFALYSLLWLLWCNLVLREPEVTSANDAWCKILHVILTLFLISNYSWMLCEGLYLHTVLVSAFISETKLLRCMVLLGWGLPAIFVIPPYAFMRHFLGDAVDNSQCWMNEAQFMINIFLQIPVVGTVGLNLLFLFNILRVLCVKLRKQPQGGSGASRASLQALRATLLLVPLLGLNFLLTPFRPEKGSPWEYAYEIVSTVTASLQGLCVAILFCFCNGEVIAQVKRKWRTATFRPRTNSCTVTTVSVRKFVRSSYPNGEEKI